MLKIKTLHWMKVYFQLESDKELFQHNFDDWQITLEFLKNKRTLSWP